MKVTEIMFSGLAAKQYAHFFNKENDTAIKIATESKEGISFVTIDFSDTPIDLALSFMYKIGELQEGLRTDKELLLPIGQYPLPPKEDVL
ncbi:hypothetical protein I2486_05470 [Cellulophaga sp. E16_2]|uniref:hypothetical protein n=1 Tax=Cellulophaga sp. E16_2 TaxID=2789297 RepID=UPI001A93A026|nr:hypothetical protein [Cellulophaga sp. E16_2]MBO0590852.1 hypothetical protein [Cellulophaga sp. E16_2]